MNANIPTISATCLIPAQTVSPSQKAGMIAEGKPFWLIQDEISSETIPSEDTTSNNIEQPTPPQKVTEQASDESNAKESRNIETVRPGKKQKIESEESNPVCQTNEKTGSEPVLEIETSNLIEQDGEMGGDGEAIIQTAPLIPSPQANSQPLVVEEIVKSTQTDHVVTDENQTIPDSVQANMAEVKPTADNPSESIESADNTPTFKPIETSELNLPATADNTEKPLTGTQTGDNHTGETKQNEPVSSDSPVSAENSEETMSSTKGLLVDGLTNDDSPATTDGPAPIQAEPSQTPSTPSETDSGKRAPTSESISELQTPEDKESTQTGEDPANTSDFKSLDASEVQTSASQPETQRYATDNNSFQEHIEKIHIQNDPPVPVPQQSLTSVENPKAADVSTQSSLSEISTDVGKQILESIQHSSPQQGGQQLITVRLNPPELGKVLIKFQEQNSELTGSLEVNRAETRVEIEQALPQIIRDLANAGIQIRRLDVMLSEENRSGYEGLEDESPQNSGLYEQNSTDSQTWDNDAYTNGMNDWSTKNTDYHPVSEFEETHMGEGSINMLI